jgi:hypothetical protein
METEEGSIYAFSKDRKSISVNGKWFRNYVPLKEDIIKGIDYKITYTVKKVGDTEFNNIKSIVALENTKLELKEKVIQGYEFKPNVKYTKEQISNNELLPKQIPNQTQNTILMNINNLIIAEIESGDFSYTPEELTSKILKLSDDFKQAYNNL